MDNPIYFRLQHQYQEIELLVDLLSPAFYLKRHNENKWSIHEQLCHLGRYHEIFSQRINRILEEDTPQMNRYKAEDDKDFHHWLSKNKVQVLEATKQLRSNITTQVVNLSPAAIVRKGVHPKYGKMDILEWTNFFVLHESHHIYSIFRLIAEYK